MTIVCLYKDKYMAKANKGEKCSGWEGSMAHPKHVMCALNSAFFPFLLT